MADRLRGKRTAPNPPLSLRERFLLRAATLRGILLPTLKVWGQHAVLRIWRREEKNPPLLPSAPPRRPPWTETVKQFRREQPTSTAKYQFAPSTSGFLWALRLLQADKPERNGEIGVSLKVKSLRAAIGRPLWCNWLLFSGGARPAMQLRLLQQEACK